MKHQTAEMSYIATQETRRIKISITMLIDLFARWSETQYQVQAISGTADPTSSLNERSFLLPIATGCHWEFSLEWMIIQLEQ